MVVGSPHCPGRDCPSYCAPTVSLQKKAPWPKKKETSNGSINNVSDSVYVGYPRIAQGDINDSTLDVTSMEISEPSPDGFHLNQKQVIGSGSTFKPKLYSFDADVSLLGSPKFTTVTVPDVQGRDGYVVDIDQWVDLSSVGDFEAFSTAVMMNEEFKLNIYGEPRLKLGALPTIDIDYNKTITMKGKTGKAQSCRYSDAY